MTAESKQTHTPAPWEVMGDDEIQGLHIIDIEAGHKYICAVQPSFNDEDFNFELTEIDRANARLIAAAPDLLAALRSIDKFAWSAVTCDCQESHDGLANRIALVRAAITKATGGAP